MTQCALKWVLYSALGKDPTRMWTRDLESISE